MVEQSEHLAVLLQLVSQRLDDRGKVSCHEKRNVSPSALSNSLNKLLRSFLRAIMLEDSALIAAFQAMVVPVEQLFRYQLVLTPTRTGW